MRVVDNFVRKVVKRVNFLSFQGAENIEYYPKQREIVTVYDPDLHHVNKKLNTVCNFSLPNSSLIFFTFIISDISDKSYINLSAIFLFVFTGKLGGSETSPVGPKRESSTNGQRIKTKCSAERSTPCKILIVHSVNCI